MNTSNIEITLNDIYKNLISFSKFFLILFISAVFALFFYYAESQKNDMYSSNIYFKIGQNADPQFGPIVYSIDNQIQDLKFKSDHTDIFDPPGELKFTKEFKNILKVSIISSSLDDNTTFLDMTKDYILNNIEYTANLKSLKDELNYKLLMNSEEIILKKTLLDKALDTKSNKLELLIFRNTLNSEINVLFAKKNRIESQLEILSGDESPYVTKLISSITHKEIYKNTKSESLKGAIIGFMLSAVLIFIFSIKDAYREKNLKS